MAEFAGEKFQQLDLLGATRREIAMPALGRHRVIFVALPDQRRFAQTRARGEHSDIAVGRWIFRAMQYRELGRLQMNHAVGDGGQIVKQANRHALQCARQRVAREFPWNVGGVSAAVDDRSRHAEAGGINGRARSDELDADRLEAVELRGRVAMLAHECERARGLLEKPEIGFGSADIAGQDEPIHSNPDSALAFDLE